MLEDEKLTLKKSFVFEFEALNPKPVPKTLSIEDREMIRNRLQEEYDKEFPRNDWNVLFADPNHPTPEELKVREDIENEERDRIQKRNEYVNQRYKDEIYNNKC